MLIVSAFKNAAFVVSLFIALSSGSDTSLREAEAATRLNILFVLADDAHVSMLGRTPSIEAELVERGTTYANTVSNYPLCCPGRVTLLTGQYAHNHGIIKNNGAG